MLISASNLSSRPDKGPAPPRSSAPGKRTRAAKNLARPARSSRPSGWKRKFSLGGDGVAGLSCPLLLSCSSPQPLGIPSHQPGGLCRRGWIVGWAPYAHLGNSIQFALHFSAPNNSPHFTAVCPLDDMQGTREFEQGIRNRSTCPPPCREPIVSGNPYSPSVPASLKRQSAVLRSTLVPHVSEHTSAYCNCHCRAFCRWARLSRAHKGLSHLHTGPRSLARKLSLPQKHGS